VNKSQQPLFTTNGEYALVVVRGPGQLAIVAGDEDQVVTDVKVGDMPHWIATTADNKLAYVTNENSNEISVVDIEAGKVVDTIAVGKGPRKSVLQPPAAGPTPVR